MSEIHEERDLRDIVFSGESGEANLPLRLPVPLRREEIEEINRMFKKRKFADKNKNFLLHDTFLQRGQHRVLLKIVTRDSGVSLRAEKTSAVTMQHKNILRLMRYHKAEGTAVLVFPFAGRGSLDDNLSGARGNQIELRFQDKHKIAVGIAQGVRYMHEDCPGGPVVHGALVPSNIFLTDDLRPVISGFERAKWLRLRKSLLITHDRCRLMDFLDQETMTLVKSDILSFGILLLRLFCRRSAPEDDTSLIKWAQPFLFERAFHKLLDEDSKDVDPHGMYRVFCVAHKCISTMPASRPCMSDVIAVLKGVKFCCTKQSPYSDRVFEEEAERLPGLHPHQLSGIRHLTLSMPLV